MFGKQEGFPPPEKHDAICHHHSNSEDVEIAILELIQLFEISQIPALDICDLISAELSKARKEHPMTDE